MRSEANKYAIETFRLGRSFGRAQALRSLDLHVPRGSIYGLLGRNGSGKTTAIKILAGLIKPTSGLVRVLDREPFDFTPEDRQRVGYVSEKQILPAQYRVGELAKFCAPFYPRWDHGLMLRLMARFNIEREQRISEASQGTQRQIAFILALAQRPDLLILDEPASTLDAVVRREFLDEILDLVRQEEGRTVLISSHILSDIERVADHVGILVDGALKIEEPLDDLAETVKQVRFHSFTGGAPPAQATLPGAFRTVRSETELLVTARIDSGDDIAGAAREMGAGGYEIIDLALEDIFVEVSRR